jgi:hypothetical protein
VERVLEVMTVVHREEKQREEGRSAKLIEKLNN